MQRFRRQMQHSSQPPLSTQSTQKPKPSHWSAAPLHNVPAGAANALQVPLSQIPSKQASGGGQSDARTQPPLPPWPELPPDGVPAVPPVEGMPEVPPAEAPPAGAPPLGAPPVPPRGKPPAPPNPEPPLAASFVFPALASDSARE
jgi:hypothetical protein